MPEADPPPHESFRLATLNDYGILDTEPEARFDRLAQRSATLLRAPMAAVSLVDGNRQWFKASHGLDTTETPRADSFCTHGVEARAMLIVTDATKDSRFAASPLVTRGMLRSYVGAPLIAPNGMCLGMLAVAGTHRARRPSDTQLAALAELARQAVNELERHRLGPALHPDPPRSDAEAEATRHAAVRIRLDGLRRDDVLAGPYCGGGEARPCHRQPVDVVAVIDEVLRLASSLAARSRVMVEAVSSAERWTVLGDKAALTHAVAQLCANAVAACPAYGRVRLSLMHAGLGMTEIGIFNAGPALSPLACAQALTPLGQPCAAGGDGTGIALPIARFNMARFGGSIALRGDAFLGGTMATVTVPTVPMSLSAESRTMRQRRPERRHGAYAAPPV